MNLQNLVKQSVHPVQAKDPVGHLLHDGYLAEIIVVQEGATYIGLILAGSTALWKNTVASNNITHGGSVSVNDGVMQALRVFDQHRTDVIAVVDENSFLGVLFLKDLAGPVLRLTEYQDSFVYSIIHDLRNPLSNLHSMISFLKGSLMKEENKSILALAEKCLEQANGLTESLLTVGQMENAVGPGWDLKEEDIYMLLNSCIENAILLAREKQIQIVPSFSPAPYRVLLHKTSFERAVQNILANAVKFSFPGKNIYVVASVGTGQILISIKDEGIGIPFTKQGLVFEKFTAAKRKGTQGEFSTGLGMYTAKKIIQMHRGKIWLESEENKGTTFFVTLPLLQQ